MNAIILLSFLVAGASAFQMRPFVRVSSALQATPGGTNMKPMADGTWKEAGAHLEVYSLDHSCGAKALVDTETATAFSWKDASGKEYITSPAVVHMFPSTSTPIKGHFVPEERAKKVSFDRMIFKIEEVPGMDQIEYRSDVTMREDCLEYDVTIINRSDRAQDVTMGLKFNLSGGMKVVAMKGYTQKTDDSVSTGKWTIPVGKFKETNFYCKIAKA